MRQRSAADQGREGRPTCGNTFEESVMYWEAGVLIFPANVYRDSLGGSRTWQLFRKQILSESKDRAIN